MNILIIEFFFFELWFLFSNVSWSWPYLCLVSVDQWQTRSEYIITQNILLELWVNFDHSPISCLPHPMLEHWYGEKNSLAIWSMESTRDTCLFEHAIRFKRIPWAFFEKTHFEKFKFLFWKYLDFKKYLEDLRRCKIQFWTTFVFCTKLIFQLPFKLQSFEKVPFLG